MIELTRLNGQRFWLNPLLVESIERTPDTIVTLTNGHKYILQEPPERIVENIVEFLHAIGLVGAARKGEENSEKTV